MVEFYAWVDSHLRTICGLTQETTCWQVVEALCEATGKKGQHLLWEVWRDFGRPISPRESVVSLMRQWGQELPTVRFVLKPKEAGSVVKRHAQSKKQKLYYYTEENKVITHKPKRKLHKSYRKTNPKNIIIRECHQLNCRILETMHRIRGTENSMDIIIENKLNTSIEARIGEIQTIEDRISLRRRQLRSLKEENVELRQKYIEKISLTQDLKREKDAVEGTAQDLSVKVTALTSELATRSSASAVFDTQISDLEEQLHALKLQLKEKSETASKLEDQVAKVASSDISLLKPSANPNTLISSQPISSQHKSPPRFIDSVHLSHLDTPELPSSADSTPSTYSDFSAQDLLTSLNAHILSDKSPIEAEGAASTDVEDSDDIV
ncbi:hypothetical protein LOD99_10578 [Oopsacas minuta]|uniref:Ras-associating domain-containing protein n=1 Tax=Oopsacas minuta TaxID=111878 RepID=A0AAV7KG70_9METZ|nr:hypothetical protein LOD99_10578 [Oopsacas minuta]